MANPLFNILGGRINNFPVGNIMNQYMQLKQDPGKILDLLFQNGKINMQQYNDLQPYRNNPQAIVNYLSMNGNANQINTAENLANQLYSNR